jgi:translation initiation factor 1
MYPGRNNDDDGLVYSTNPGFNKSKEPKNEAPVPATAQDLRVWFEKRNGKPCTIIRGYKGPTAELKELGRSIRQKCSVGGAEKDGEIILQGDVRAKVMDILKALGFKAKNAGG